MNHRFRDAYILLFPIRLRFGFSLCPCECRGLTCFKVTKDRITFSMFDSSYYPKSLDEGQFEAWLEKGRLSKIGYSYLLIIWDALEEKYLPTYVENRDMIHAYEAYPQASAQEALIAVYDLYSEAKINFSD